MINSAMHLAKRELQYVSRTRAVWASTLCAGVILGLLGPFNTDQAMPLLARLAYWCTHAVISFALGSIGAAWGQAVARSLNMGTWTGALVGTVLSTPMIVVQVMLVDYALFGPHRDPGELAILVSNVFAICAVLNITLAYLETSAPAESGKQAPALLARLSPPLRGALVSISVSDHYVEVTTTLGKDMLLLRLGDAIRETEPTDGFQIHRSHWVAANQIARLHRREGKAVVTLQDGRELPVSRTYLPDLKKAGF